MKALNQCRPPVSLLYVEDDPATRATISSIITKKYPSLSLRAAENGQVGLQLFKECSPDIVLTDISMPVMDGIQMTRNIRAINSSVDIIAATAFSDTQYLMDAINVGIRRYVLKPVNFKLLFEAIDDCLGRIDMQRQIRTQYDIIRKLSRAVEQSPSMVIIADASGAIEYVNPEFSTITGFASEDVLGENLRMVMTNASPIDVFLGIWSTVTGGFAWRGEIFNRKKSGELYCENISISPLFGETGEITNFVAVMEDVRKLKLTQDAIRQRANKKAPEAEPIGAPTAKKSPGRLPRKQMAKH
jgi:PAS domain S-box-containing protein